MMNTFQALAKKAIRIMILSFLMILFAFNFTQKSFAKEGHKKLLILKAAMVIKFIKYTQWPKTERLPTAQVSTEQLSTKQDVANLCILKSPQLFSALKVIEGKVIRGKKLLLKQVTESEIGETACHILYLGELNDIVLEILSKTEQAMLTISDQNGFAVESGMIELTTQKTHLSFNINLSHLNRVKLKINSAVLELAKQVYK